MVESLLIVGLAIPSTALLLLVGGLVGGGSLNPLPIIVWGVAGAVVCDAISYYIGRLLGPKIVRSWPLNQQRRAVSRARYFFYTYGVRSEEHTSELQPLMRTSYAVFCLTQKRNIQSTQ